MSLLLGLCHSVGVCSSANLFLETSKSSEIDFLCSIDFFSIQAIFPYFSYLENNITAQKKFFFAFLIVFFFVAKETYTFLKLSLRSCHFLNRQPAEWNPLWASGGDHGYRPLPSSSVVLMVFWVCCEAPLELCFEVLLDLFTICLFIHFNFASTFHLFFFFLFC